MKMRGLHRIKEIEKPNNSKTLTKKIHGPSEEDVNRKHCVFDRIFLFRCTNKWKRKIRQQIYQTQSIFM